MVLTRKTRGMTTTPARPQPQSVLARALAWQEHLHRTGATRADLARRLGVSRAWITQGMAILDVPAPVMDAMRRREAEGRPVTNGVWKQVKGRPPQEAVDVLVLMGHADRAMEALWQGQYVHYGGFSCREGPTSRPRVDGREMR
ncbi:MAG: KorB domain [Pseudomonadota bacterium]|jgi:ParB-like chromosome segregation protein Spo0J